eukprot:13658_6
MGTYSPLNTPYNANSLGGPALTPLHTKHNSFECFSKNSVESIFRTAPGRGAPRSWRNRESATENRQSSIADCGKRFVFRVRIPFRFDLRPFLSFCTRHLLVPCFCRSSMRDTAAPSSLRYRRPSPRCFTNRFLQGPFSNFDVMSKYEYTRLS